MDEVGPVTTIAVLSYPGFSRTGYILAPWEIEQIRDGFSGNLRAYLYLTRPFTWLETLELGAIFQNNIRVKVSIVGFQDLDGYVIGVNRTDPSISTVTIKLVNIPA